MRGNNIGGARGRGVSGAPSGRLGQQPNRAAPISTRPSVRAQEQNISIGRATSTVSMISNGAAVQTGTGEFGNSGNPASGGGAAGPKPSYSNGGDGGYQAAIAPQPRPSARGTTLRSGGRTSGVSQSPPRTGGGSPGGRQSRTTAPQSQAANGEVGNARLSTSDVDFVSGPEESVDIMALRRGGKGPADSNSSSRNFRRNQQSALSDDEGHFEKVFAHAQGLFDEDEEQLPWITRLVLSSRFDGVMAIVVALNALMMGIEYELPVTVVENNFQLFYAIGTRRNLFESLGYFL